MKQTLAIIVKGANLTDGKLASAVESIPGLELRRSELRGVGPAAAAVLKWVGNVLAGSGKIADFLIQEAMKHAAGASIEVQVGTTVVKVSNANRDQIMALLDKAVETAKGETKP